MPRCCAPHFDPYNRARERCQLEGGQRASGDRLGGPLDVTPPLVLRPHRAMCARRYRGLGDGHWQTGDDGEAESGCGSGCGWRGNAARDGLPSIAACRPPGFPSSRDSFVSSPAQKARSVPARIATPIASAGKAAVIPRKAGRKTPRDFDRHTYKARHLIENFFAKLSNTGPLRRDTTRRRATSWPPFPGRRSLPPCRLAELTTSPKNRSATKPQGQRRHPRSCR